MFVSRYMPCERCGASVDRNGPPGHLCVRERLVDFQMFGLRGEVARFPVGYLAFLESPHGRFETWLAARQVRHGRR